MRFTSTLVTGIFALTAHAQSASSAADAVTSAVESAASSVVESVSSAVESAVDSATSEASEIASTTAESTATPTHSTTPEESLAAAVQDCLEACDPSDVGCQSQCITVPNPDEDAVNKTTDCVAKCPQGKGTEEDTQAYIECSQKCIGDYFQTTTFTGGPTQTSGGSSGTASATPSATTVTSGSSTFVSTVTPSVTSGGSSSPTESSSEDGASETDAEGAGVALGPIGSTGLLGLVAAFLAL